MWIQTALLLQSPQQLFLPQVQYELSRFSLGRESQNTYPFQTNASTPPTYHVPFAIALYRCLRNVCPVFLCVNCYKLPCNCVGTHMKRQPVCSPGQKSECSSVSPVAVTKRDAINHCKLSAVDCCYFRQRLSHEISPLLLYLASQTC